MILVANVAPIFDDLLPFLIEAEPLARQSMALVQNVGPGSEKFYYGELYPHLLGRPYPGREDYLRTLALLHSIGIYANAQIIGYNFDQPFDSFLEAVQFWKELMHLETADQESRLVAFLEWAPGACRRPLDRAPAAAECRDLVACRFQGRL